MPLQSNGGKQKAQNAKKKKIINEKKNQESTQFTDVTFRHTLAALIARFFRQGLSLFWKKKLMTFVAFFQK